MLVALHVSSVLLFVVSFILGIVVCTVIRDSGSGNILGDWICAVYINVALEFGLRICFLLFFLCFCSSACCDLLDSFRDLYSHVVLCLL